jgi:predicted nucleotidyltransferase
MDRETAISLLKAHEAELRRLGVQHLYLFGSTARGKLALTRTSICSSTMNGAN